MNEALLDYSFDRRARAEAIELLSRAKDQEHEVERIPIYICDNHNTILLVRKERFDSRIKELTNKGIRFLLFTTLDI
ncbi:hypothetical protein A9168_11470 [Macellibacteroides sp. HH-ZS]|nr:hypothetical protein A9168_11470 [Macellibacteroides sp. HH-ZS]